MEQTISDPYEWFDTFRTQQIREKGDARLAYSLAFNLMKTRFTLSDVEDVIGTYAIFDLDDENKNTQRGATLALKKISGYKTTQKILSCIKTHNFAGYEIGDVLYFIHPCTKTGSPPWQQTSFGKGVGPLGDIARDSVGIILEVSPKFYSSSLPNSAKFIPPEQLGTLIDQVYAEPPKKNRANEEPRCLQRGLCG